MARRHQLGRTIAARISAYEHGKLRTPEAARDMLGITKNDEVRITLQDFDYVDSETTFSGHIDSQNCIHVGREVTDRLLNRADDEDASTVHIEATVEPGDSTWNDDRDPTEKRWARAYHLLARLL